MTTHNVQSAPTLSLEKFWGWLLQHPNCILRAGSPEAVLYDDDDLHWYFASDDRYYIVQLIRGKRLVGELFVDPEAIAYVQGVDGDQEGEYIFDLIAETETDCTMAYFFVLTHALDEEEDTHARAVH